MSGIEKIIAQIEEDNQSACNDILIQAENEAKTIIEKGRLTAEQLKRETRTAVEVACNNELTLAESKAEHEKKRAILAAKTALLGEVIAEAMQRLKNTPDADYFNLLKNLVATYAQNGEGSLQLSAKDHSRLPQDFVSTLNEALKDSRKTVLLDPSPAVIDGGFIIRYRDIEQNCSFDTLLDTRLDAVKDTLYATLFTGESL